ncbi:hypothetical protein [Nocardioides sp. P5_C9_2]
MTSSAPEASASYAAEVARLLWPAPWGTPYTTRALRPSALPHREAYIFPSARNPRLLVPTDLPAAATMLGRLGNDGSRFVRPMRSVLQRSVRSPAFALARWPKLRVEGGDPRADSIENHLGDVLGTEVRVGVVLGPRRVNQKPVLQIFGLDGTLVGYAKVGHNALTAALVRHEAEALRTVGGLAPRSFRAPQLLHHGSWCGLDVLVMSPLSTDRTEPVNESTRIASMLEVARLGGVRHRVLSQSAFWSRLRTGALRLADVPHGSTLPTAVLAIEATDGGVELEVGGWHGDWGPWNMGMSNGVLQLWDWERYEAEVPLGFDGLHLIAQGVVAGHRDQPLQERHFLGSVSHGLSTFGVDPSQHDLVLRLYLLEMAVRYVDALTHGARPEFERRTAWVVSLLTRLLELPRSTVTEGRS